MRFQAVRANNEGRVPEVRRFFALDCYRLTPLLVPTQYDSPVARRPVAAQVDRGAVCPMGSLQMMGFPQTREKPSIWR
ncbi:hypothetical protein [Gemmatimonas sp.]|uniref:hypothetical protein n=1 Tax=Gemmatimonas sp. TaxID=1962908 RepID=UPI0035619325